MKILKKIYLLTVILGAMCFIICGCKDEQIIPEIKTSVEESIVEYVKENADNDRIFIDISELTDFDWDAMFIYSDGITRDDINKELGINYEGPLDAYKGLIFIKDNKFIYHEELKKDKNSECLVDFSLTPLLIKDQGRKFTQSNDVFICYYDGSSCRLETILREGDEADGGKCGDSQIEEDNKVNGQECVEQLINAMNDDSIDDIKKLLSPVLTERKDTEWKLKQLIEMLDGPITDYEEIYIEHYPDYVLGEARCILKMQYSITTKDKEYVLVVGYLPQNITELNNTGIYSVRLMDYMPDDDKYIFYSSDYLIPGIYPSTIAGIESNSKILTEYVVVNPELQEYYDKEVIAWRVAQRIDAMGISDIKLITTEICEDAESELEGKYVFITDSACYDYRILVGYSYTGLIEYAENITTGEVLLSVYH